MAIQLILCMETTKKAATDDIYISETIHHVYQLNNQIKISRIYMESKNKYNAKNVLREIRKKLNPIYPATQRLCIALIPITMRKIWSTKRNWMRSVNFVSKTIMI